MTLEISPSALQKFLYMDLTGIGSGNLLYRFL